MQRHVCREACWSKALCVLLSHRPLERCEIGGPNVEAHGSLPGGSPRLSLGAWPHASICRAVCVCVCALRLHHKHQYLDVCTCQTGSVSTSTNTSTDALMRRRSHNSLTHRHAHTLAPKNYSCPAMCLLNAWPTRRGWGLPFPIHGWLNALPDLRLHRVFVLIRSQPFPPGIVGYPCNIQHAASPSWYIRIAWSVLL